MKIGIGIQCHDHSTRFPLKSVRSFYSGKSILEIIIERFRYLNNRIVVITTKDSPKTIHQAKKLGVAVFIDKPKDLAGGFLRACLVYGFDAIVRVCADNPFVQLPLLYPLMSWGSTGKYDYVAFEKCMLRHDGLWCEFILTSALEKLATKELSQQDKEHCTKYIYEHPQEFTLLTFRIPPALEDFPIRLTVDTKEDFYIAKRVYKSVKERNWNYLYGFLKRNYTIIDHMKKNILKNRKDE